MLTHHAKKRIGIAYAMSSGETMVSRSDLRIGTRLLAFFFTLLVSSVPLPRCGSLNDVACPADENLTFKNAFKWFIIVYIRNMHSPDADDILRQVRENSRCSGGEVISIGVTRELDHKEIEKICAMR